MARSRSSREVLIAELRESFGRVVYTHKAHEKEADINKAKDEHVRIAQLVLSVAASGSTLRTLLADWWALPYASALIATALAIVTGYAKSFEAAEHASAHSVTARRLWLVREQYLSLLADVEAEATNLDDARVRRDKLQVALAEIYDSAPRTTSKAYGMAQVALKVNEELTFSDKEIDMFLPDALRRGDSGSTPPPLGGSGEPGT